MSVVYRPQFPCSQNGSCVPRYLGHVVDHRNQGTKFPRDAGAQRSIATSQSGSKIPLNLRWIKMILWPIPSTVKFHTALWSQAQLTSLGNGEGTHKTPHQAHVATSNVQTQELKLVAPDCSQGIIDTSLPRTHY